MGSGFFPGVWCSRRQFLGLDQHQGLIKLSMVCGPRGVSPAAVVFSTMHSECPFVRERSQGWGLERGRESSNPLAKSYFPPDLPPPGREAGRGPIPKGQAGKSQGRALPSESKGCPGQRPGARGTGAPGNQWGRVNPKPHGAHSASFCGNSCPGVRLRCRR